MNAKLHVACVIAAIGGLATIMTTPVITVAASKEEARQNDFNAARESVGCPSLFVIASYAEFLMVQLKYLCLAKISDLSFSEFSPSVSLNLVVRL